MSYKHLLRRAARGKPRNFRGSFRAARMKNLRPNVLIRYAVTVISAVVLISVIAIATTEPPQFPRRRVNVHPDVVAAFQIPQRNILVLRDLAEIHAMDFPEVLAVYSLENAFFPNRQDTPPAETIEHMFIGYYEYIRASFRQADILRYEEIFRNILAELRFFPVPLGFDSDPEPSYMFGDSWGTAIPGLGGRLAGAWFSRGINIYDRENIPGRIPVVAVASGSVIHAGHNNERGYYIEIEGERGTIFIYSHLHTIDGNILPGTALIAGEFLGTMGNTGSFGTQIAAGNAPVRLGLTFAPDTNLVRGLFHINPYPFLSLLEVNRVAAPPQPGQPAFQMPNTQPLHFQPVPPIQQAQPWG